MAKCLEELIATKFPRLYHYGPTANASRIERFQAIFSSELIRTLAPGMRPPGTRSLSGRRRARELIETRFGNFTLNDQDALKYGHVKDTGSLAEREFVALLDQVAFFWPGSEEHPIEMGGNFVNRYLQRGEAVVQVTVSTVSFLAINNPIRIFVSNCNSGAPRSNPKVVIYRGTGTFVPLMKYDKPVAAIKEIAVLGYARLPEFQISFVSSLPKSW